MFLLGFTEPITRHGSPFRLPSAQPLRLTAPMISAPGSPPRHLDCQDETFLLSLIRVDSWTDWWDDVQQQPTSQASSETSVDTNPCNGLPCLPRPILLGEWPSEQLMPREGPSPSLATSHCNVCVPFFIGRHFWADANLSFLFDLASF